MPWPDALACYSLTIHTTAMASPAKPDTGKPQSISSQEISAVREVKNQKLSGIPF